MGKPWNNESAEKWCGWARGRHVRQKELARSVRRREGARAPHARGRRGRSCVRRPETSSSVRQTEYGWVSYLLSYLSRPLQVST